jgi:hypothetical protein
MAAVVVTVPHSRRQGIQLIVKPLAAVSKGGAQKIVMQWLVAEAIAGVERSTF